MMIFPNRSVTSARLDRTQPGDVLRDELTGERRTVVDVASGRAILSSLHMRGSHSESCALHGGTSGSSPGEGRLVV